MYMIYNIVVLAYINKRKKERKNEWKKESKKECKKLVSDHTQRCSVPYY